MTLTASSGTYAEIARLRAENDDLREANRQLIKAIAPRSINFPEEWRLQRAHRRILASLYSAPPPGFRSYHALRVATGGAERGSDLKTIHVQISAIRKLVRLFNVVIETVPFEGYRLPPASKKILAAYLTPASLVV